MCDVSMPLSFLFKKLASAMVLPPLAPLLLIAGGLLLLRRRPALGRAVAWAGLLVALLMSVPATTHYLIAPLEDVPLLGDPNGSGAQAIVVLSGGSNDYMPEYAGPGPNRLTLERLRYAVHLVHRTGLPLLVSGGSPEAEMMAMSLAEDFGVGVRWGENQSLDTAENARFSVKMLKADGIERVLLVTHAAHMKRAMNEFLLQGIEVTPAPTAFFSRDDMGVELFDYVPGMSAYFASWYAIHEWVGLLVQRFWSGSGTAGMVARGGPAGVSAAMARSGVARGICRARMVKLVDTRDLK